MIEVRVRFFGPIRALAGGKERVIVLEDGATLKDLLEELKRTGGADLGGYIVVEGNTVNPVLMVSLDGQSVDDIRNMDLRLPERSVLDVMLVAPLAGG